MTLHIPRLPWHQFFMLQAHLIATRSTCDRGPELLFDPGRHGVGAVLVKDKRIIAGGYNGSPPGQPHCNDTVVCSVCGARHVRKMLVALQACGQQGRDLAHDKVGCDGHWELDHLMVDGHCVRTIHAERNALHQCALDGTSPAGATLYVTASPCYDCAKDLVRVGIKEVFFSEPYESRYGLSPQVLDFLRDACISVENLILSLSDMER